MAYTSRHTHTHIINTQAGMCTCTHSNTQNTGRKLEDITKLMEDIFLQSEETKCTFKYGVIILSNKYCLLLSAAIPVLYKWGFMNLTLIYYNSCYIYSHYI